MAIDEAMLDVSKDHGSWSIKSGNQVRISKLIDMFLIIALMIRTNVQALIHKVLTRGQIINVGKFSLHLPTTIICVGEYNFQPYGGINF